MRALAVLGLVALFGTGALADGSDYVSLGSVGAKPPAPGSMPESGPFRTVTVKDWVGERFVFLTGEKSERVGGRLFERKCSEEYEDFTSADGKHPSRQHLVGKVGKVTSVTQDGDELKVTLRMEDSGEVYSAHKSSALPLTDLAPVRDIDEARKLYLSGSGE